jgi:hypothetical protein
MAGRKSETIGRALPLHAEIVKNESVNERTSGSYLALPCGSNVRGKLAKSASGGYLARPLCALGKASASAAQARQAADDLLRAWFG